MLKEKISAMSDDHNNWLSGLTFYKDELAVLKTRLTEIAGKNTNKEVSAEIEHFENQIRVQLENIDVLHHDINSNLAKSAAQLKDNSAGYIDAGLVQAHEEQKDRFDGVEKVIRELRQEFSRFASIWM